MIDSSAVKQAFKDATDDEARELFQWVTTCMEVRGLIPLAGAVPTRRRRSDAGTTRKLGLPSAERNIAPNAAQTTVEAVRERLHPSLSGLPDETRSGD